MASILRDSIGPLALHSLPLILLLFNLRNGANDVQLPPTLRD